jgi:hypothetical protein
VHWHTFWAWLATWQGAAIAAVPVLAAIYYGPRKMLETWDWYWDRFRDNAVLFVIQRRKLIPAHSVVTGSGPQPMKELPFSLKEIAEYLGRKESSVQKSIKRLKRHGKIEPFQDGWHLKQR